ncbi:hypothetical protein JCM11251_007159, partial [Rhodosporidiobolus azoricus]
MSFRSSLVRLAQHARTPLIRFPDRKAKAASRAAEPHPCAPQTTIDAFPQFQHAQKNPQPVAVSQSSSYGGPNLPPKTGGSSGASLGGEDQLPAWLRRNKYAPTEEEIEAVMVRSSTFIPPHASTRPF